MRGERRVSQRHNELFNPTRVRSFADFRRLQVRSVAPTWKSSRVLAVWDKKAAKTIKRRSPVVFIL